MRLWLSYPCLSTRRHVRLRLVSQAPPFRRSRLPSTSTAPSTGSCMWCLPARATVQCPRPPSTPPSTSNSNGCFCDETPENTGCTASCIADGSNTPMTCGEYSNRVCSVSLPHSPACPLLTRSLPPVDFLELWYRWEGVLADDWNFWEANSDPDACDVYASGQIVTVEEFTADESPGCDCTGCLCDGTMDETTSDWRACPATCGTTTNDNGGPVMMTCGKWPSEAGIRRDGRGDRG